MKISDTLTGYLTDFFNNEIGSDILNGVTYAIVSDTEKVKIDKYMNIRNHAKAEGFGEKEFIKGFELCNGYLFDMNSQLAKKLAIKTINNTLKENEKLDQNTILAVNQLPKEAKESELKRLANYVLREADKGNTEIYVALYSKNSSGLIKYRALVNNKKVFIQYSAYKVRVEELESLNKAFLIKKGVKIDQIQACEILPTCTGIKFKLVIKKLPENMGIIL